MQQHARNRRSIERPGDRTPQRLARGIGAVGLERQREDVQRIRRRDDESALGEAAGITRLHLDDVRAARFDVRQLRAGGAAHLHVDGVDEGSPRPRAVVRAQRDAAGLNAFESKWTRPDEDRRRAPHHDGVLRIGKLPRQIGLWTRRIDHDDIALGGDVPRVGRRAQGRRNLPGFENRVVVEGDAGSQVEPPAGAANIRFPRDGQPGPQPTRGIDLHERVEDQRFDSTADHRIGTIGERGRRIERPNRRAHLDPQRPTVLRPCRIDGRDSQRRASDRKRDESERLHIVRRRYRARRASRLPIGLRPITQSHGPRERPALPREPLSVASRATAEACRSTTRPTVQST